MSEKPRNDAPSDPPATEDGPEWSFEDALAELESVVERLEDGRLTLTESLEHYERGVQQLRRCYQLLDEAEDKIRLVVSVDEHGVAELADFEDAGAGEDLEQKKRARDARRSARSSDDPHAS